MSLQQATPGMVLAEDLLTPRGKLVLPKGATLTEASLASLPRYEVTTVTILLSEALSAEEDAALQAHRQERIARLFRRSADDQAALQLRQAVTRFYLESNS